MNLKKVSWPSQMKYWNPRVDLPSQENGENLISESKVEGKMKDLMAACLEMSLMGIAIKIEHYF